MKYKKIYFAIVFLLPALIFAQSKKKLNIEGDFYYDSKNYAEAENFYSKSVEKKEDFISLFNKANSQEMQEKREESLDSYKQSLSYADSDKHRAIAHYNLANTLLNDKELSLEKLEEAVENYKSAIKFDPLFDEARHNLSAAQFSLDMKQQQQEQEQQQQEQQEQEEKQDQEEQEKEENQEQQEQEEQKEQEKEDQKEKDQKPQQSEEEKKSVDKSEIENILKMVEKEDKEVQEKMRKKSKSEQTNKKKKW